MSKANNQNQDQTPVQDTNELIAQLQAKLDDISASGKQPYPNTFKRTDYAQDLQTAFDGVSKQEIEEKAANGEKTQVNVAGRVMLNRGSFIVIQDMTSRIQLYVARKGLMTKHVQYQVARFGRYRWGVRLYRPLRKRRPVCAY